WIDVIRIEEELTKALENAQFSQSTSKPVGSIDIETSDWKKRPFSSNDIETSERVQSTSKPVGSIDIETSRILDNSSLCSENLRDNDKPTHVADAPCVRHTTNGSSRLGKAQRAQQQSAAQHETTDSTPPRNGVARINGRSHGKLFEDVASTYVDTWEVTCARRLLAVVKDKIKAPIKSKAEGWAKWFV